MKCTKCQFENPDGQKFCGECGAILERVCSHCGGNNPPGYKFCGECGYNLTKHPELPSIDTTQPEAYTPKFLAEKILQSKSAMEGERKQVTVLFVDVKGSMDLAEQVDPEEWHRILNRFFHILADGVHRFEGTINQYTGDGIMALFGAPIAHEDHGQRACYAALYLSEELRRYANELRLSKGLNFAVRMGLNSGEVIVGKIGDDLRMDYTAQGQTVGLAARMEQIAEPGKIYLAQDTAKAVQGYFELEDLGDIRILGIGDPVRVSELRGLGALRTRLDVARTRGFSRFVGRTQESQTLEAALARAREGHAQVVGVMGEAGTGKSRLCYEFLQSCRARGLGTLEAHGVAHGKVTPLVPILELFRSFYGITEQDSDRNAREKIAGRLLLLDETFREALPVQFEFLGVADSSQARPRIDPEARQRQLFALMKRVIQLTGRGQTAITLLEDLHWFDGGSRAFLEQFVDAIQGTHGLLVVTFRPEFHAGWMQKSYYQQVPLLPLGTEAIRELLDDLLGTHPSLTGLPEAIQERTAGNPFFIEEVVHSLVESGQLKGTRGGYRLKRPEVQIAVPDTVQAVLSARIDRQGEREKDILQMAAVIGKTFSERLLARVTELDLRASLEALKGAEFIYESSIYPQLEYAFKHPLTQEVAYGSQLGERRQRIHAAVARALEELDSEKLDEHAALLAHHWEGAGEGLEAARWHRRAAEWVGLSDIAEARRHWQRVRKLIQEVEHESGAVELGIVACRHILMMAWRLGLLEADEHEVYADGKRWVERIGDRLSDARLEWSYSISHAITQGDLKGALEHAFESQNLLQEAGELDLAAVLSGGAILALLWMGRLDEARLRIEQLIEATRDQLEVGLEEWGNSSHIWAFHVGGMAESFAGDLDEASRMLDQCAKMARTHDQPEIEGWALADFGYLHWINGDFELGLASCRRSAEIAERVGSGLSRGIAHRPLGLMLMLNGQHDEAVSLLEQSLRSARDQQIDVWAEAEYLAFLSEAYLLAGNLTAARAAAERGVTAGQRNGTMVLEGNSHVSLARVILRQEGRAAGQKIRDALDQAESLYNQTGAKNFKPFVHLERAELARLQGDSEERHRELQKALTLFREMKAPIRVREIEELLK